MAATEVEVPLTPPQRTLLKERQRWNTANWGRRTGKTTLRDYLIPEATLELKVPVAYLAPNYPQMQDVFHEDRLTLAPFIESIEKKDYIINYKSGLRCRYWSAEKYENMRGHKYGRIIWDEVAHDSQIKKAEEIFNAVIRPCLADYKGDLYAFSTPKGMSNFWYTLCERGMKNRKGWHYSHATPYDNPFIADSEIEEMRADMPELIFRQEILAEFVELAGAVFKREYFRYRERLEKHEYKQIGIGADLAITEKTAADYTAIVVHGLRDDGTIDKLDSIRMQTSSEQVIQDAIISMGEKWLPYDTDGTPLLGNLYIAIESVAFQSTIVRNVRRRSRFNVIKAKPKKDKLTRAFPLISRYEQGLVYHADHNENELATAYEQELLGFAPPFKGNDDQLDGGVYSYEAATRKPATIITL